MDMSVIEHLLSRLKANPDWKFQINITDWQTDFLRFYDSQINYNISKENSMLEVSVYKGKKSYSFSCDQPSVSIIDEAIDKTTSVIDRLPEDPDFIDVETDKTEKKPKIKPDNLANLPLDVKISILQKIGQAADEKGFDIFGTFICNKQQSRIINSNGLDKSQINLPIYFEVKAVRRTNQVTVLQTYGGEDFASFDLQEFISKLTQKMDFALFDVIDIKPGPYEVILAPRCIAELMLYLSGSMSARSYDQKTSCFENKLNHKVFPDYITITDDPDDLDIISFDYNSDGHVYRPLKLVEKGVFRNFMCNNYYAHKTGLPKNGNNGSCLVLHYGDMPLPEMVKSVQNGIYVSSLHYMNFINQKETSVTGLTRDGTFLIEDGKITKVINNLRFTDKITRVFENIKALEDKSFTIPFSDNYGFFEISCAKAPHVWVSNFNITSSTRTI
jgi:predicted Zn-dependent protease